MGQQGSVEWQATLLRAWHLALLRLALTRNNADRAGVFAIAKEIDRLGPQHEAGQGFSFFRRTSGELSTAMLRRQAGDEIILNRYLAQIDDLSLRRTLAAALGTPHQKPDRPRKRAGSNRDLWRGLPSRAQPSVTNKAR